MMQRRKAVKALALSTITPQILFAGLKKIEIANSTFSLSLPFKSSWHMWPDMLWASPDFWGNRLQDWQIRDGKATCVVSGSNRSLHCLTCQLSKDPEPFETSVTVEWLNGMGPGSDRSYMSIRIGAKGQFEDYRSAAVFGKGLDAGITTAGQLFIGKQKSQKEINKKESLRLRLKATPEGNTYRVQLTAFDLSTGEEYSDFISDNIPANELTGNIALVSHIAEAKNTTEQPSIAFANWEITGKKVQHNPSQAFGPICFAQYTLHNNILKLNAQLAPIEAIKNHEVTLQINEKNGWKTIQESPLDPMGRIVQFKIENWERKGAVPYRVRLELTLLDRTMEYFYEGVIAQEPIHSDQVKMAVFSCNADYGFPDSEVPLHVAQHQPDMAVFLGDQFYERTGGFGIETAPVGRAALDYLRKWYMFGWSYRDIFRRIPVAFIPDDHDVYHGNVWGEAGKKAPTENGWGYVAQDQGGYKMPPEWINMVQRTQTSHLPDPFDPTPVQQEINVYYTNWNYGGISFAILEDRKFKSAPKNILPEEAKVENGFIQNPDFEISKYYDVKAELLGDRQMKFLDQWTENWTDGVEMKAVLSQTNFCTVATLPGGTISDQIVPKLPIPEKGDYIIGDAPTTDMDSNGWPQKGRDEALKIIRKSFALHIAGDQHLASMVHYGVEEYGDAGYAFAGPALNNLWPRRWWPSVNGAHKPLPGQPAYTGNFNDGFGNLMTVHAVANPHKTGIAPARIYDRATGYGIVSFNKKNRTMKIECWPRHINPEKNPDGQFQGWPITVSQDDNYARKPAGFLPMLKVKGVKNPVVQVMNENNGEIEYTLRIKGSSFRPKVYAEGSYTIKVSDPEAEKETSLTGIVISQDENDYVTVKL